MSSTIKHMFESKFPIKLNREHTKRITSFYYNWLATEGRGQILNTPYLGVTPIYFTYKDQDTFFSIFGNPNTVSKSLIRGITNIKHDIDTSLRKEVKKHLADLDVIEESRNVQSDPFNVFITYIIHLFKTADLKDVGLSSESARDELLKHLMNIWQIKFFTSLVNQRFPHPANEEVMRATLANMNNKFAIVKYGTWLNLITSRSEHHLSSNSPHKEAIDKYDHDGDILYMISNIQTGLRNQVNLVTSLFYQTEKDAKIGEYTLVGSDLDGDKLIMHQQDTLDNITVQMRNDVLSISKWITPDELKIAAKLYKEVREDQLKSFLTYMNQLAFRQSRLPDPKGLEKTVTIHGADGDNIFYEGVSTLISNLIVNLYRNMISRKINLTRKLDILKATQNIVSANRFSDDTLRDLRDSVDQHISHAKISTRYATVTSIRGAFVTYLILKTFKYIE